MPNVPEEVRTFLELEYPRESAAWVLTHGATSRSSDRSEETRSLRSRLRSIGTRFRPSPARGPE
jgi:hypothetical protein